MYAEPMPDNKGNVHDEAMIVFSRPDLQRLIERDGKLPAHILMDLIAALYQK